MMWLEKCSSIMSRCLVVVPTRVDAESGGQSDDPSLNLAV
jgi:hypothetical protein